MWNSLPLHLRQDMHFVRLKRKLKTLLFRGLGQPRRIVTVCYVAPQKYRYLLTYLYIEALKFRNHNQRRYDVSWITT